MKNNNNKKIFPLAVSMLIAGIFILAGCSPSKETAPESQGEMSLVTTQENDIPLKTPVLETEPNEQDEVTDEGLEGIEETDAVGLNEEDSAPGDSSPKESLQPSASPSPEETAPPPKTELEATDPSTVNLASGELQLIEFFAFW